MRDCGDKTRRDGLSSRSSRAETVPVEESDASDREELLPRSQSGPTITHLFINNESVMSRSQNWTTVLDPVFVLINLSLLLLVLTRWTGLPTSTLQGPGEYSSGSTAGCWGC